MGSNAQNLNVSKKRRRRDKIASNTATGADKEKLKTTLPKYISKLLRRVGLSLFMIAAMSLICLASIFPARLLTDSDVILDQVPILYALCGVFSFLAYCISARYQKNMMILRRQFDSSNAASGIKDSQLKALTDDSHFPIFILAQAGICVYSNIPLMTLLEIEHKEFAEQGWKTFFQEEDLKSLLAALSDSKNSKQKWSGMVKIRTNDGKYKSVEIKMTPSIYQENYVCTIASIHDLSNKVASDNKPEEVKLEAFNIAAVGAGYPQLRKRLTFPLKRVSQSLSYLSQRVTGNASVTAILKTLQSDAEHMCTILEDFSLSHLKIQPESWTSNEKFSPQELARGVEGELQKWILDLRIAVGVEVDSSVPDFLFANVAKIREILLLILEHSVQSTKFGGIKMNLSYFESEGQLCFEIIDTGAGLSPQELAILLGAEEVLGESNNEGLNIARSLVNKLGGVFDIESMLKRGSVVQLLIPAKMSDKEARNKPIDRIIRLNNSIPNTQYGAKVLLFGEESKERNEITELLEDIGISAKKVNNPQDAFRSLFQETFQLVILDSNITSKIDNRFKDLFKEHQSQIPFVYIRRSEAGSDESSFNQSQFQDTLESPISSEALYNVIAKYVSK